MDQYKVQDEVTVQRLFVQHADFVTVELILIHAAQVGTILFGAEHRGP